MNLSACIIVKNEQENIITCLESLKPIVSQIVVVDTGSDDDTVKIAKSCGAEVYYFKWVDDFSKARNYAISKAKGKWIISIDADEYIEDECKNNILTVIDIAEKDKSDVIITSVVNYEKNDSSITNSSIVTRIFRNDPDILFEGPIHENLVHKSRKIRYLDASKEIRFIHTGYTADIVKSKKKSERNLNILLKQLDKNPENSDLCFYISEAYIMAGDYENAINYGYKVIEYNNGKIFGIKQKNYLNMLELMLRIKYPTDKYKEIVKKALIECPEFADIYAYQAKLFDDEKRSYDLIESYEKVIQYSESSVKYQSSIVYNIENIYTLLGIQYYRTGQVNKCVSSFTKALKLNKFIYPSSLGLISIAAKTEQPDVIYDFLQKLYDYTDKDDLKYLLNVSLNTGCHELAEKYLKRLKTLFYMHLDSEEAQLFLLNGNYYEAAKKYRALYQKENKDIYAVMCIVAAHLSNQQNLLSEISAKSKASFVKFINLINDENGNIEPLSDEDRKDFMEIIDKYIMLSRLDKLPDYLNLLIRLNMIFEAADIAYNREKYDLVLDLYGKLNEMEYDKTDEEMAAILFKIADCLYKTGDEAFALDFLDDAQKLNPRDYRIYELGITICRKLSNREKELEFANAGIKYFDDSNFFKSSLTNAFSNN